jgi:hydrogenase maturation protease
VMPADPARVLVAGVGNVFLGDDGFGPEVIERLAGRALPDDVRIVDFGIRAVDLAFALLDRHELVVLVDAAPRGGTPGTLYLLEPDLAGAAGGELPIVAGHSLVPEQVLHLVRSLGAAGDAAIRVVGCEPAFIPDEPEIHVGLSPEVAGAVDGAVALVERLVRREIAPGIGRTSSPIGSR